LRCLMHVMRRHGVHGPSAAGASPPFDDWTPRRKFRYRSPSWRHYRA
jgi:hypothetical protein